MKKISLFAFALSTGLALCAQQSAEITRSTRLGIKAGANFSKLRPSDFSTGEPSTNLHTSLHAGVLINIPVGMGGFAVEPEVLYSGHGSKMNVKNTIGTVTTDVKYEQDMNYIDVPIMLQWKSAGGFYVETGPQAGFLVKSKQEGPGDTETDNKKSFEKFEFSWAAGLGYMTRMGLGLGARYNHGFTNTLDNEGTSSDARLRSSVINVGLFYHIGAGK